MKSKKIVNEELKSLSYKDLTALLLEEKGKKSTLALFEEIVKLQELPKNILETKIGDYYTSLTTDKRFVLLEDGSWDLRCRHTSDKVIVKVEMDDDDTEDEEKIESDDETEEDDYDDETDDDFDEEEDDLKDLVVIDEDELEAE